jgi:aminoglycoside 6'-N-acetyltransferase/ribosomal-protein-alanine N-acetyltransferase
VVKLVVRPASARLIDEMTHWQYDPPYELYSGDGKPPNNPERYLEVRTEDGQNIGFYYFERRGDAVFFGLGLRPDQTGRGLGLEFVKRGLRFARRRYGSKRLVLDVASFNQRAITVYKRAGFEVVGSHRRSLGRRGAIEFIDMELTQ